jgi:lipid II:glycine glycyltransferase (peptidoglycan interpeptide bridge formation enzyme)
MFHRVPHLRLQREQGWIWFYVKHEKRSRIMASIFVNVENHLARSAVKSPYGTIECTDSTPHEVLFNFISFVEESLRKKQVNYVRIACAPNLYMPEVSMLMLTFLPNLGYRIASAELSACLKTEGDFSSRISQTQKQSLLKASGGGLDFQLISVARLEEVYTFIDLHHRSKGYPLSMSLSDLLATVEKFPDRFILCGAFKDNMLIAASVAIRVKSNVLYNFYMDHDADYDRIQPVLVLLQGLFEYGKEHHIPLLDLGTSAIAGKPNFGLLSFKTRLGAELTPKLSFEKNL